MSIVEAPIAQCVPVGDPVAEFIDYCNDFYNIAGGLYPIASRSEISRAVGEYLENLPEDEFCGDSLDRERVRCILQPEYQMI